MLDKSNPFIYGKDVDYFHNEIHEICVELIGVDQESRWNTLMKEHHYLGFNGLIGEQLKYVAILNGEWVALLGWAASSFKSLDRDQWIGWRGYEHSSRLKFIANNWRFLILPGVQLKNLASKILSLNLKRLSRDWELKYAHPIYLVETFIDPSRYTGSCYRADNWLHVGGSRGFQKEHKSYIFHGNEKLLFIKPLTKQAKLKLKGTDGATAKLNIEALPIFGEDGLFEFFKSIADPRSKQGLRHRAPGLLVLCMLAILSGATTYKGITLWIKSVPRTMLGNLLLRDYPHKSTIRLFLMGLDAELLDSKMTEWLLKHIDLIGEDISFDGKTLRGSRSGTNHAIQLVSAVVSKSGIILSQTKISQKTNEIPVVQSMIKTLPLEGTTITGDALQSQVKTSLAAQDKHADAVFIFKDNQQAIKEEIKSALTNSAFSPSADPCHEY